MAPDESLWQAGTGERGVISATFYARLRKYMVAAGLQPSGVHILRHTSAKFLEPRNETEPKFKTARARNVLACLGVFESD
jgi:hypothetical protein